MVLEKTAFMQCITVKEQGVKSRYHILMTLSLGQDINHSTVHHTDSPSHTSKHPFMEIPIVSLCCLQWASKSDYMSIRLCVHCISLSEFYKHSNAKSHWTESQPSWELKRQATLCYAHYRKIGMHSFFFFFEPDKSKVNTVQLSATKPTSTANLSFFRNNNFWYIGTDTWRELWRPLEYGG